MGKVILKTVRQTSKGAREELGYAREWRKQVLWEDESAKEE